MMGAFWEAFEQAKGSDAAFGSERQTALRRADAKAGEFFATIQQDSDPLNAQGLRVVKQDRTVSFRHGSLELLAINFGTSDGEKIRISSPVIEYLKLDPAGQEIGIDADVAKVAGRWLGLSIEAWERNRPAFAELGYA